MLLISISFSAFSQNGNPLQFLSEVSQSSRVNPAFQNKTEKLVFGIPMLSGIGLNWDANFAITDFSTDDFSFDYQNFYNSLDGPGEAFTLAQAPIIFLSLRKNNRTFSFSIYERIIGSTDFDREILNFYAQGLQPYYGKNEDIGPISIKANYFREIAFGYSTEIWKGFSLGVRPKILFGKFFYEANNINVNVSTDAENEMLIVSPEGIFTISGPVKVVSDEENDYVSVKPDVKPGDYFFKLKNMGAGIDLGLTYKINTQTEISVSLLDLGFTSFKDKAYDIVFTESLDYKKSKLFQSHDPGSPEDYWSPQFAAKQMMDSIPYITVVNNVDKRNIEALPFQANIELKHKLQDNLQVGFSNHYTYYKNHSSNYLTGALKSTFSNKFEAVATLSLYNLEKVMPGIGASYTGESSQFFVSTNNIIELVRPTSAKSINLCFGVNFLFSTD